MTHTSALAKNLPASVLTCPDVTQIQTDVTHTQAIVTHNRAYAPGGWFGNTLLLTSNWKSTVGYIKVKDTAAMGNRYHSAECEYYSITGEGLVGLRNDNPILVHSHLMDVMVGVRPLATCNVPIAQIKDCYWYDDPASK